MTPGRKIFFSGECILFRVENAPSLPGKAWIRTNLGRAAVRRKEVIDHTEQGVPMPGMDWHDIPMEQKSSGVWEIALPLTEIGVFEAKCFFSPADGGKIKWPGGGNFVFKVEPAQAVCGNSIYSAFVRQFGANCSREKSSALPESVFELDRRGFTVIPPSGTFRDVIAKLDHIFDHLGCRILQLLPVHPTPAQYGRMGRYGSPFAALDYFNVDPALAEFDETATPLEQFGELIDAVHARNGMIFMDIPVNHTGWASKLQSEHPEYFVRQQDGRFESPGAWGVVWADLCKLNYKDFRVHELMADVFLFWCRRGVNGFRCDAGYMLPADAWEYITSRVRSEYPDTIFLLEGLGGPADGQELLLGRKGLDWGYSELFQNYTRDEISRYQPYMEDVSSRCGALVSFAETHDNLRLAATSKTFARLRFLVCSLLSSGSAFGFVNGAEFFAAEKIDVHGCGALNFGNEDNLSGLIFKINQLLCTHPAFFPQAAVRLIQTGPGNVIAAKRSGDGGRTALILLNLDCDNHSRVFWSRSETPGCGFDLISGNMTSFDQDPVCFSCGLAPGQGCCIVFDDFRFKADAKIIEPELTASLRADLMARKAVLEMTRSFPAAAAVSGKEMLEAPELFVEKYGRYAVRWQTAVNDDRRLVMLAPDDLLLVKDEERFHCEITDASGSVLIAASSLKVPGRKQHFALFSLPGAEGYSGSVLTIRLTRFPGNTRTEHRAGKLRILPAAEERKVPFCFNDVEKNKIMFFASNTSGGYALFPAAWGSISSKYQAMLAANIDPRYPVDRRVLLTNCRAWLVINDYSQEIDVKSLTAFTSGMNNRANWRFMLPAGQGCRAALEIDFEFAADTDAAKITFRRLHHNEGPESPAKAKLILRPILENRVNHEVTKAFSGPEQLFPQAVTPHADGFDFSPYGYKLSLRISRGKYCHEPEWQYMCHLPDECYYGLEDHTDRFSPGYFEISMDVESEVVLTAFPAGREKPRWQNVPLNSEGEPGMVALEALKHFVVKRDELSTVLAGYPWFLDWGRDTLIALRGLVRAKEFHAEAVKILRAFAGFEKDGTIPNVIRGEFEANRDTSDAPLYLIVAVRDYINASGDSGVLDLDCSGRTLKEVLISIVENYIKGTPNGIRMDHSSKLIYSPAHFSWMDTNFPAGTPRSGYPVEIQALWFAALKFLGYNDLAEEVRAGIDRFFFLPDGSCSDCLHCDPGVSAAQAVADDHNRSNQLLLITLGAVQERNKALAILRSAEELLVPGGIRSLADRKVRYLLPVKKDSWLLNDPEHPYRGIYAGPEDTSRKAAYHNGTVWCWPFFAYCEAFYMLYGKDGLERAKAILMSAVDYMSGGIPGQLPEVADGDAPHTPGGCPAQAWSISEFYRVYELLSVSH